MNDPTADSQTRARPNGGDPVQAPGGAIIDALHVLDCVERATLELVTGNLGRLLAAGEGLMIRHLEALVAIGTATLDAVERTSCKATASTSSVAESIITSIGGFFRRLIVAVGEAARTGLDQIDQTAQQVLESGRDTFEKTLDSASSLGEASARFAERVVIRSLDAGSEMGGALRGALRDGSASVAGRPPSPNASGHALVAS
jgi:hypothetical protein